MQDIMKQLAEVGLSIIEVKGEYQLSKRETTKSPFGFFVNPKGEEVQACWFGTYEDALDHAMSLLGHKRKGCHFSINARFDRGLGWEYRVIPGVRATTWVEAEQLAAERVTEYFSSHDDLQDVLKREFVIKPGRYAGGF